jgi:hypothetical protein
VWRWGSESESDLPRESVRESGAVVPLQFESIPREPSLLTTLLREPAARIGVIVYPDGRDLRRGLFQGAF